MSSPIKSTTLKDTDPTNIVSQLERFIRRAAKAKISMSEPGAGDWWTVVNGEKAKKMVQLQEEDDDEWVVVEVEMLEGV